MRKIHLSVEVNSGDIRYFLGHLSIKLYIVYRLYTGDLTGEISAEVKLRLSVETANIFYEEVYA